MLEITSLPAKQGDAIWIKWGDAAAPHQMIIDMGTRTIGKGIRDIFEALPADRRHLDLLVISHVDADHIGGVLTCLSEADPLDGLDVDDIWFNGFAHLSGGTVVPGPGLEPMGPVQGERLSKWLRGQVWNKKFGGAPVVRVPGQPLKTASLHDGLKLTVLGPTPSRLTSFIDKWKDDVHEAIEKGSLDEDIVSPGLEIMGSNDPPILEQPGDLKDLAEKDNGVDGSLANGSSIALLLQYKGRKIILSGDAFADDLVDGINAFSPVEKLKLDVFKLPHHGSKKNVHINLIQSVDCDNWLISTDGTRFKHPDAEAIARIISFGSHAKPLVSFNVPSKFNEWWKKQEWIDMYNYEVMYGDAGAGLTLDFELN